MIELINVSKRYVRNSTMAVQDVSFSVSNGEIMGFAGLNGAGKTTTIKISAGVMFPSSGNVLIDNVDIIEMKRTAALNVAWVPESPIFDVTQKPRDLFLEFGSYFGMSREVRKEKMNAVMSEVGLEEHLDHRIGTFSDGMRKRFMIALSLFQDPKNYLLDETFNGLDPEGIRFLKKILTRLKREGKSVLLSSHLLGEFEGLADRIAIIHKGHIIDISSVAEIQRYKFVEVECRGNRTEVRDVLDRFGEVSECGGTVILRMNSDNSDIISEISKIVSGKELSILNIREYKNDLEGHFFWQIYKI